MRSKVKSSLRTIRVRIIAIVALCWLLPTLVLGVYMSSIFFSALREKTEQALVAGAQHAQEMVEQEVERILKKSKDVTYDEQLSEYISMYKAGVFRYEELFTHSRNYWKRMFQRERIMDFSAAFMIDEPDKLFYAREDASVLQAFQRDVLPYILELGEALDTRSRFAWVNDHLYHVRNLLNRRMERFGMLVLEIYPDMLFAPFFDESQIWQGGVDIVLDEYIHIADPDYPWTVDEYREGMYEQDGDLCYSDRVKTSDYTLTYRIRLDESVVFGQVNEYYNIIIALILFLLPLEALIMVFIHTSMTRPLMRLSQATERLAGGELGITVPTQGGDEIGRVGMAFNAMSLRMQNLIDKSYREELALRDARISALQSRINPHFLNNALELMNWQARLEGATSVSEMIESMSTLINAALDRVDERTVPLSMEVEVADAYFFFIQQRFGERVSIEKDIDPALQGAQVPRLIIQTLLENAVEHGINPMGGGVIRLHVYEREEMLYIDVRNDGRPLTQAEQEKIDLLLDSTDREARSEHLGIRNVNLRLRLIYHDRAGLTLTCDDNGETLARIFIPYNEAIGGTGESEQP